MSIRACKACGSAIIIAQRLPKTTPTKKWDVLNADPVPEASKDANAHRVLIEQGSSWRPRDAAEQFTIHREVTEAEGMNLAREYPWHSLHRCQGRGR